MSGVDKAIRWILLVPVGLGGLYNFVFHVFFGELTASYIGWSQSPFQLEVGVANLGLGVVGVVGFFQRHQSRYWLAATLMTACFLWGAAAGHIYQMFTADNFAPGNAGFIFYLDLAVPAALVLLLIAYCRKR